MTAPEKRGARHCNGTKCRKKQRTEKKKEALTKNQDTAPTTERNFVRGAKAAKCPRLSGGTCPPNGRSKGTPDGGKAPGWGCPGEAAVWTRADRLNQKKQVCSFAALALHLLFLVKLVSADGAGQPLRRAGKCRKARTAEGCKRSAAS